MQTFKIEKTKTQCVVTWRQYSHAFLILLIPFAYLTIPCVIFVYQIFVQRAFFVIVLAIPMWIIGLLSFTLITHMLFGKMEFVLNDDGLDTTYTCLTIKWKKWFNLVELHCFEKKFRDRRTVGSSYSLRVVCQDDKTSQSFSLPPKYLSRKKEVKEIDNLCEQLNAFLETLKAQERGA